MSNLPPVYCGNYEYDASERELERLFDKYGRVNRVEYKTGFCFVHFDDKRDAEDFIRAMDGREWGRLRRRLRVEFAKNDANVRTREETRRKNAEPNKTLFVAGFDPRGTRSRDIERAFEAFGRMRRCEIKKTYAFVEFEDIADAKEACNELHGSKINGREITVEYVVRDSARAQSFRDDDRPGGFGFGGRDRGGAGRPRSRSRSRSYDRRRRSPSYSRSRSRSPPRRRRSPSVSRSPPRRRASPSPVPRGRSRSRSPVRSRSLSRSPPPRSPARSTGDRSRSPSPRAD
ncbi:hypothetical protein N2152v2_001117 [Parachlorella kessleri]